MDNETFRSRLLTLVTKSRKALRLYSNVGRFNAEGGNALTELQTGEWKGVTAELLRSLSLLLENPNARQLVTDVVALRDRFNAHWRTLETDLHSKQRELLMSAESSDFVRAALLSKELIVLKARMQAAQAAHHELQDVVRRSKVAQTPIELTSEHVLPDGAADPHRVEAAAPIAKVIPLRKQSNGAE